MAQPTLKSGMSGNKGTPTGDAILTLRNYFNLAPAATETNYSYGPQTVAAVKTWQAAHGLSADGVFGPQSWAKFAEVANNPNYGPPSPTDIAAHVAATAVAAATPVPKSAQDAVAALKKIGVNASLPASRTIAAGPPVASHGVVAKAKDVEHGIIAEVEALYNKTPLWARIGLGTFSTLLTIVGLKKLFFSKAA